MSNASIIWWRDIPTQIICGKGRKATKVQLHNRFTVAVDRAAMVAGATDTDAYLEDWRKSQVEIDDGDVELAVKMYAEKIEQQYPNDRLGELAKNSGYEDSSSQAYENSSANPNN